jgi:hypothetical protein
MNFLHDEKTQIVRHCLSWIIPIFDKHQVPYQIVGGLAARLHGAHRPLFDLDFYADMSAPGFSGMQREIQRKIVWGPTHFKDENWDITFLKMDFDGQRIEIGDSNGARFFNRQTREWVSQAIDYADAEVVVLFGLALRVMRKERLISYKKMLGRQVDLTDVSDLERSDA